MGRVEKEEKVMYILWDVLSIGYNTLLLPSGVFSRKKHNLRQGFLLAYECAHERVGGR